MRWKRWRTRSRQRGVEPPKKSEDLSGATTSDQIHGLELAALQRQLDDAFETTRPRVGFEDELWTRMQARRPASTRLPDAWLALVQGIRQAPAVPMGAVAVILVVALGVGVLALSGFHLAGGGGAGG